MLIFPEISGNIKFININYTVKHTTILLLTHLMHFFVPCSVQESDAGTYFTVAETTSGEVRCRLPVFPLDDNSTLQLYNWTISVSRDNSTWSNSAQMLVYDPDCVICNDDGNQTTCLPSQVNQSHYCVCVVSVLLMFCVIDITFSVVGLHIVNKHMYGAKFSGDKMAR